MASSLSHRLTQYLDCLLDDESTDKDCNFERKNKQDISSLKKDIIVKKYGDFSESSCRIKKKKKQKKDVTKEKLDVPETYNHIKTDINAIREKNQVTENPSENNIRKHETSDASIIAPDRGFTCDGFRIVGSIPEDDSDVSDAFESYIEEEEDISQKDKRHPGSLKQQRKTEDGFRITSEVPPDDSDVSDAFEEHESFISEPASDLHKKIKRPLIQIMDDFGLGDGIVLRREEAHKQPLKMSKKQKRKNLGNTMTEAAKMKNEDLFIIDYTQKRGSQKKNTKSEKEEDVEQASVNSKDTMDERQLKRVRYDVFKLGMSGFHKEKREDTRVALAIKLGAKPPKNKAVNYKELLKMKKDEKKKEADEREIKQKLGLRVPKPYKKEKQQVKASASQIGRYRQGVQVLSKRDVFKINNTHGTK